MQAVSKINFPGWVGVGVVGLYENKANSARPAGAGAGAWLSLAISPKHVFYMLKFDDQTTSFLLEQF